MNFQIYAQQPEVMNPNIPSSMDAIQERPLSSDPSSGVLYIGSDTLRRLTDSVSRQQVDLAKALARIQPAQHWGINE